MTFLVWKHTPSGPVASKDEMDPRRSNDWKIIQQTTIRIEELHDPYDTFGLDSLIVCFPCPAYDPDVIARAE